MRLSVAVTHTPWIPERARNMKAIRAGLKLGLQDRYQEITQKAPLWVWSSQAWTWAADMTSRQDDWAIFLQDDIALAPDYLATLRAMLAFAPGPIVGLETVHPAARTLAREGHRWCATSDGLVGRAYAIRQHELAHFLSWRDEDLRPGAVEAITEDTLIGVYALATGQAIYHPIPAPQLHLLAVPSAQGNERDAFRTASVTWLDWDVCGWSHEALVDPAFWQRKPPYGVDPRTQIVHLGRLWDATPWLGSRWVRNWTEELHAQVLLDLCPLPYARRFPQGARGATARP
jgi:hypothetical protein